MPPLSTAVAVGDYVFLSGIPPAEEGHVVAPDDASTQAEFVLQQMNKVLSHFGLSLEHLVYVQLYLRSMKDYEQVNAIYERCMPKPYPARKVIVTTFAMHGVCLEANGVASRLPKESKYIP